MGAGIGRPVVLLGMVAFLTKASPYTHIAFPMKSAMAPFKGIFAFFTIATIDDVLTLLIFTLEPPATIGATLVSAVMVGAANMVPRRN